VDEEEDRGGGRPRDPEALCADIERAFAAGEWVVVCWEPGCPWHRLIDWPDQEWAALAGRAGYARYTHGICPEHLRRLMEEIEDIETLLQAPPIRAGAAIAAAGPAAPAATPRNHEGKEEPR
jgi:hypothetical protein